jgi:hypothetical protein
VITSLWRVGDSPSAELMTRFYGFLASGDSASIALRKAKLAFRRSRGSARHPAFWAAFVLTGDPDLTIPRVISWPLLGAGFLLSLLIAWHSVARIRRRARRA